MTLFAGLCIFQRSLYILKQSIHSRNMNSGGPWANVPPSLARWPLRLWDLSCSLPGHHEPHFCRQKLERVGVEWGGLVPESRKEQRAGEVGGSQAVTLSPTLSTQAQLPYPFPTQYLMFTGSKKALCGEAGVQGLGKPGSSRPHPTPVNSPTSNNSSRRPAFEFLYSPALFTCLGPAVLSHL